MFLFVALFIGFLFLNPSCGSYEPFGTVFGLNGEDFNWYLLFVALVASFFVHRFWCHVFCPAGALLDFVASKRRDAGKKLCGKKKCPSGAKCGAACPSGGATRASGGIGSGDEGRRQRRNKRPPASDQSSDALPDTVRGGRVLHRVDRVGERQRALGHAPRTQQHFPFIFKDDIMLKSRRRFLLGASAVAAAVLLKPWSRFDLFPAPADAAGAMSEQTRLMMGTLVSVRTRPGAGTAAAEAVRAAFAEAARLEALLTRHESAAPLGVLNRQGTIRDVPPELRQVLSAAAQSPKPRITPSILWPRPLWKPGVRARATTI